MPERTDCQGCICWVQDDRGFAYIVLYRDLCRELRAQCLCQKQVTLALAGVIEGNWRVRDDHQVSTC